MNERAFADATRLTPVVVLRLPLREYSLGHELLLQQRRSPILELSPKEFAALPAWRQRHAIQEAAWICANTHAQNTRERALRLKYWLWNYALRRADYTLEYLELRNYLIASRVTPRLAAPLDPEERGRTLGAPLLTQLWNYVAALPEFARRAYASPWDFPFALAAWSYFTALENESRVNIENEYEARVREEIEAAEAEVRAEQAQAREAARA